MVPRSLFHRQNVMFQSFDETSATTAKNSAMPQNMVVDMGVAGREIFKVSSSVA